MGVFHRSALVAALLAIPMGAAAGDYPEPPPYLPPPVDVGGGWYLRGHIGMTAQHFDGLDHDSFATATDFAWLDHGHFSAAPAFGIGVGIQVSEKLRIDFTGEYRGKANFSALDQFDNSGTTNTDAYDAKTSEWLFLANAYYDLGLWHGMAPYIGAGVGLSRNSVYDFTGTNVIAPSSNWAPSGHEWSVAWALHAGASMQVTDNLTLDLGYSFVSLGDARTGPYQNVDSGIGCAANAPPDCTPMTLRGLYSHDVKLGLRWMLDRGALPAGPMDRR